jgi:ERCC4-type nuclease
MCITYSQDIAGTARNVVEHYKYFQKKWTEHKSMLEMQKLNLPCIDGRPSLARQWAAALTGIGPDLSERAAKHFGSGLALAVADESDWTEINGIARPTARKVIKEIEEVTGR